MILSHALQRSVSNTTDTAVHVLCVLLFLPNNFTIIIRVLKIAPANGAITGYHKVFATCKLLERSEKNGQLKKLSNKKKEIVEIMIYMFFFVKDLIYLGNTYPL